MDTTWRTWFTRLVAALVAATLSVGTAGAADSSTTPDLVPFGPVPNLTVEVEPNGIMTLTWDPVDDAVSYWVDGGARTGVDGRRVTVTRYQDFNGFPGANYVFQVFSERADGTWSEPAVIESIPLEDRAPFGTPPNPRISFLREAQQLVQWDMVRDVDRYEVTLDGEPLERVPTVPGHQNFTIIFDEILTDEVQRRIEIRAVGTDGTVSAPAVTFYGADLPPFGAPANPRLDVAASGIVTVRWDRVAGAQDYVVHRDGSFLGAVTSRRDTFVDRTAEPGGSSHYEIRAVRYEDPFAWFGLPPIFSAPATVQTHPVSVLPPFGPPGNATIVTDGSGPVTVSWDEVADAKGFVVHRDNGFVPGRDASASRWEYLGFVPTGSSSFVDDSAQPGQPYRYAIRAQRPDGSYSAPTVVDDLPPFGPPRLTEENDSAGGVLLRWDPVAEADSYVIHRDGVYVAWRRAVTELSYGGPSPAPGETTRYEVRAKRVDGTYSEPSVVTISG